MVRQLYKRIERRLAGRLKPRTDAATSTRMGRVRQHGTRPELIVRRALTALGMRYRTHNRDLPGSPDIANRLRRWAVFVHGCYWHRHPGCRMSTTPKSNTSFWLAKFGRNVERDREAQGRLRRCGYDVLVIWQCEAESSTILQRRVGTFAERAASRSTSRRGTRRPRHARAAS